MDFQPRRTQRSWTTDDGSHVFVETASFHGPGMLGGSLHASMHDDMLYDAAPRPRRPAGSFLHTTFTMLDNLINSMQNTRPTLRQRDSDRARQVQTERELERSWSNTPWTQPPRRRSEPNAWRSQSQTRNAREQVFRMEDERPQLRPRPSASIHDLEEAVETQQDLIDRYRRWLDAACDRDERHTYEFGHKLANLREHERLLEDAKRDLYAAQRDVRRIPVQRPLRDDIRLRQGRPRSTFSSGPGVFHFSMGSVPTRGGFHMHNLDHSMLFDELDREMDWMFDQQFNEHLKTCFNRSANGRPPLRPAMQNPPRSWTAPSSASVQTPQPPQRLIKPEEAKQLYQLYDKRWTEIANDDPNIPFPARGLDSRSLLDRDSIWAPTVSTPVVTWTPADVMQANIQAFFLAIAGLVPFYNMTGAKIVMGYDRVQATSEQVTILLELLKKEMMRWHSDRLGRRNGGQPGINEALQGNEQARAVFHAVCELKQYAAGG